MDIVLQSNLYQYSVYLNELRAEDRFPDSLISVILEQDPETTTISLTQSFITPEILNTVAYIINNGATPPVLPENRQYLRKAGDYFNIDVLTLLGDPFYLQFHEQFPDVDLVKIQNISPFQDYKEMLLYTLQSHAYDFTKYLVEHGPL